MSILIKYQSHLLRIVLLLGAVANLGVRRQLSDLLRVCRGHFFVHVFDFTEVPPLQVLVETILDLGDGAADQRSGHLADCRPFLADGALHSKNELILLACPGTPNNRRVKHVVPSLAALAAQTSG